MHGFEQAVQEAWTCDHAIFDPFKRLDALLRNSAVGLQAQAISLVARDETRPDTFTWPSDKSGTYSVSSTYERLCRGLTYSQPAPLIWKSWAPLKCKIFLWLASQRRVWTLDWQARHGL